MRGSTARRARSARTPPHNSWICMRRELTNPFVTRHNTLSPASQRSYYHLVSLLSRDRIHCPKIIKVGARGNGMAGIWATDTCKQKPDIQYTVASVPDLVFLCEDSDNFAGPPFLRSWGFSLLFLLGVILTNLHLSGHPSMQYTNAFQCWTSFSGEELDEILELAEWLTVFSATFSVH